MRALKNSLMDSNAVNDQQKFACSFIRSLERKIEFFFKMKKIWKKFHIPFSNDIGFLAPSTLQTKWYFAKINFKRTFVCSNALIPLKIIAES